MFIDNVNIIFKNQHGIMGNNYNTAVILLLFVTLLFSGCGSSQGSISSDNSPQGLGRPTWVPMDEEEAHFLRIIEVDITQGATEDKKEKLKEFYIQRGERYLAEGKIEAATTEFEKVQNLDPSSVEARTYLESIEKGTTNELLLPTQQEAIPTLPEYRIGFNDTLEISVWQFPELTKELVVRPDGRISFPLVGDVWAYKLTPNELCARFTTMLSEYVRDPKVAVTVKKFSSDRVIVLGEVKTPGIYDIKSTDKVLDAVALGGGFTSGAKTKNVLLVRYMNRAKPEVMVVNAKEMLDGKSSFENNFPLQHLDLVYISKTTITNISEFLHKIAVPIAASLGGGAVFTSQMGIPMGIPTGR